MKENEVRHGASRCGFMVGGVALQWKCHSFVAQCEGGGSSCRCMDRGLLRCRDHTYMGKKIETGRNSQI